MIPGFGGTSTFAKPAGAFGGFGATTNQPAPTSFGGFAATTQPAGTTGFGQTAVAGPSNAGFGGFSGTTGGGWGNAGATQPTGFTGMRSIYQTYVQVLIRSFSRIDWDWPRNRQSRVSSVHRTRSTSRWHHSALPNHLLHGCLQELLPR